jgi:proton-dependent oligopeptide transporter, POT family
VPGVGSARIRAAERRRTVLLIFVVLMTVFANISYPMIWNIGMVWIDARVNLATPFGAIPAAWFNSVDPFASIIAVPPLVALWAWQSTRKREPSEMVKIGIVWALAGCFGMGVAFLWYWSVLLALVSQTAPKRVTARLMGSAYLSLFLGTVIMGWVGGFYDQMSPTAFWLLDAAIAIVGGIAVLAIARPVMRMLSS